MNAVETAQPAMPPLKDPTMTILTDSQLEALWRRAHKADDRSMISIVERALDGSEVDRRIASQSARDVEIYRTVVS